MARFEVVDIDCLLSCYLYGLERCENLPTIGQSMVKVLVSNGTYGGGGLLFSEGSDRNNL